MSDPIEGQDEILRHGTEAGAEPLLDTLASLARTALDDPDGLPPLAALEIARYEGRATVEEGGTVLYAINRLDDIIEALNPSTETAETFAGTLRILGRHLAERADVLRAVDADGDERYVEAATDLDNALDLIDSAILALTPEEDEDA